MCGRRARISTAASCPGDRRDPPAGTGWTDQGFARGNHQSPCGDRDRRRFNNFTPADWGGWGVEGKYGATHQRRSRHGSRSPIWLGRVDRTIHLLPLQEQEVRERGTCCSGACVTVFGLEISCPRALSSKDVRFFSGFRSRSTALGQVLRSVK